MGAFDNIGAFYDALADRAGRLEREGALLLRCLETSPGRRVLDLACGTGLHAHWLAEHGCAVTALDASETMLAYARETRPHAGVCYRAGDMRSVEGGPWDFAVCLGNSLSLLSGRDDLDATFLAVSRVLAAGGAFLTQTLNYAAEAAQQARHRVVRTRMGDSRVVAVKSLVPDEDRTLLSLNFFAETAAHVTTASDTAVLRNWREEDLTRAAADAGLAPVWSAGDFDGGPFVPATSPDLLCLFRAA